MAELITGSLAIGAIAVEINRVYENYRKNQEEEKVKEERIKEIEQYYRTNPTALVFREGRKYSTDSTSSVNDK